MSGGLLGALDLAFNFADAVQRLIHSRAIAGAHSLLQPRNVPGECIEQAGSIFQRRATCGSGAAFAEQTFEYNARMSLGGKRSRGRRPGKTILIHARVTVVAHSSERVQIHRQLE